MNLRGTSTINAKNFQYQDSAMDEKKFNLMQSITKSDLAHMSHDNPHNHMFVKEFNNQNMVRANQNALFYH